ncbi:exonuclease SbcCD subunit D [Butyrivibrio sp. YAB3001]|uniref:exonuclease SbcCD subunit D n=1 Tax=Butyrivibrio sp. YAB3001 TaxID=1520812 RepID=UPI0008F631C7|nr:exonuclease SbcCD subunit D [Butyrivibrio sp. YAB3001]SFC86576.1 Exodeoxyribonuclease I subunit D [Butyrivibrio sp. YAB3001]
MKFIHLGDLHLGKSLGDFDLIQDQKYILNEILELIDKENVDALLMAGDIYDKAVPSEAATNLLDWFLSRLSEKKISTYIISGNHDSDDRLNFGSSLFSSNSIYISAIFDGKLHKQTLKKETEIANIYLLPFVKASQVKHYYPEAKIETYDDAVRTIIDNSEIDEQECNILVAHQFVAGKGDDPALGGSESAGTQSVGLVEKISYDCFDKFDYVALGHIHSPQRVGRDEVRYSGSLLKYSLSEANNEKSVPIITVNGKEKVKIELVPLKPMREMRHIRGNIKDLLAKENVKSPEDFIYATLTDEDIVNDAMGIFQQIYPNTVKIDYDNSHTRQIEQVDISRIAENKSFSELIGDFYRMVYGCEISEEEMEIMRMAAREAGVANETN